MCIPWTYSKVGGKRHAETMKQIQSEHKGLTYNYDLLRSNAVALGATKVVEYLAGPRRVLGAYTDYAAAESDDIAQYL
jgi:hypothetical protein